MKFDPLSHLTGIGVDEQVASDWLQLRKRQKADPTLTAINGIAKQAALAGYTMTEALETCCNHGWRGFKADWVQPRVQRYQPSRVTASDERASVSMALTGRNDNVIDFIPGEVRRVA